MRKYNHKSQNGAVSMFVMFSMAFFLIIIVGIYMISAKRAQTQTETLGLVKEQYYNEGEENDIYTGKIALSSDTIPIYTKEQLWSVGSNKNIEIEGKVYNFASGANYELKNDIVINLPDDNAILKEYTDLESDFKVYYYYNNNYYTYSNVGDYSIGTYGTKFKLAYIDKFAYVKDGLILHYDGINNTGIGRNTSTTIWKDLSENNNDGILNNMNCANGYYSESENGYVFLENSSYVKTTNNIGISGDDNYTIEIVSKMYNKPADITYPTRVPLWFGASVYNVENLNREVSPSYESSTEKFSFYWMNYRLVSDNVYTNINDKIFNVTYRKSHTGEINEGDTNVIKINYNGSFIPTTYVSNVTFTPNTENTPVEIGRGWQYNNENRTFYGSIQSIRIYNRPLSDAEVQQNYQVDKLRFGIE